MNLYLLEPAQPGAVWAPFGGVRPLAELRAGVWKVRERWEAALDLDTAAILVDTGTTLDGKIDAIDDYVDTEVAAIKAVTDALGATAAARLQTAVLTEQTGTIDTAAYSFPVHSHEV